jgi:hypothetical protein
LVCTPRPVFAARGGRRGVAKQRMDSTGRRGVARISGLKDASRVFLDVGGNSPLRLDNVVVSIDYQGGVVDIYEEGTTKAADDRLLYTVAFSRTVIEWKEVQTGKAETIKLPS